MESEKFYQMNAKVYDVLDRTYFRKAATSPRQAVLSVLGDEPLTVLDMCTGTGANAITIAGSKINTNVIGIDLSPAMLKIATGKRDQVGIVNVMFVKMDATLMQFPDQKFDIVLMSLILHEISDHLAGQMILEAKRVLKDKGRLIIVEWEEPVSRFKKIPFLLVKKTEPKGFDNFLKRDLKSIFHNLVL